MSISTEKELLQKIREGNERSLMQLYQEYKKPIFTFIYRQIKDPFIVEELVQDVFIAYVEKIREDTKILSLSAYIYSIARNKIVDYIRKKKLKKIIMSAVPESIVNSYALILLQDHINQEELKDMIYTVLKKMPHEYALVIRLKYIDGLRVQEIAKKLVISFKSAESLLFRARKEFSKLYHTL